MFLRELFDRTVKLDYLAEGGNLVIGDIAADRIDATKRAAVVPILNQALLAINNAFAQAHKGVPIWNEKLLASKKFLAGSSFHFFNRLEISDEIFAGVKKTVGDIDTQVNKSKADELRNWISSLKPGTAIGPARFVGYDDKDPAQILTLWSFPDIVVVNPKTNQQVPINVQIDMEMKEFAGDEPTQWSQFSTSSSWDDLSAGVKGVFHKFLIQSMTRYAKKDFLLRKLVGRGKARAEQDVPTTDSMYSFAIKSKEGGGLRAKYEPVLDDNGKPLVKNGLPVYRERETTGYVTDISKVFKTILGNRVDDKKLKELDKKFWSFVGLSEVIRDVFSPEEKQAIVDTFAATLFGKGAQGLYASSPDQDRAEKTVALDALTKIVGIKPANIEQMKNDYYAAYKVRESVEISEAAPNYARQGIQHLYNRLPDGRVSSVEMKDADFIELSKEIAANGGNLDGVPINLKVDGAGVRFGKDSSGQPFFMTSKVTTPLYAKDVGYFTRYGKEKGQSDEQLARTKAYDDALDLIVNSKFIETLPNDTIVQAEMLYNPMAQEVDRQLKFVNIPYDPKKLGKQMTLVPFSVKQYSTGETLSNQKEVIQNLLKASDSNVKIITNSLEQKGINVSKIIQPVLGLNPKNKAENKEILDKARQDLSTAIIDSPQLKGKDVLGDNMEGIVVNMPSGRLFKVTSLKMKAAMAAKSATSQSFGTTDKRTAVVAIGNFAGHRGHEQLIDLAVAKAKQAGGTPFVFVGHKVGPNDPIDIKTKIETLKKLYPNVEISVVQNQIDASGQETIGNIFKKIEYELVKKEPFYNDIIITVGSDQAGVAKTAEQMQNRYSKFPPLAHVKVSAYVTPRSADQGGTGISTTQLRDALKNLPEDEAFKVWSKAYNVQKLGDDWIRHLMNVARKNMKISEVTESQLNEAVPLILPAIAIAIRIGGPAIARLLAKGAISAGKVALKNPKTAAVAGLAAANPETTVNVINTVKQTYNVVSDPKAAVAALAQGAWNSAGEAANGIAAIVGDNLTPAAIKGLAAATVKYSLPIAAVVAILYGGKKLYDYMSSDETATNNMKTN
jgi:FAD synthetase